MSWEKDLRSVTVERRAVEMEWRSLVVVVSRPSDRLIKLKLMIAGEIFYIVSAYAPQSGETENIKEDILKDREDLMSRVPRTEYIVVGADLNGQVGKNQVFFKECMEGKAMPKEKRRGENLGKHGEYTYTFFMKDIHCRSHKPQCCIFCPIFVTHNESNTQVRWT